MGKLLNGQWLNDDQLRAVEALQYKQADGRFQRGTAGFRHWVTDDGRPGPSGVGGFKAEAGRYHLFAALNCPWAHRTLLYRNLKQLQDIISLSLVTPRRTEQGWVFDNASPAYRDTLYDLNALHQLYTKADSRFSGRVTVPVLWDKKTRTIVSNESAEIIRMFNTAFNDLTGDRQDFYPAALASEIDTLNDYIFANLNNGVYQAGFARTQAAYDEAVSRVFAALDRLEARLGNQAYLLGEQITEADWRLLPTLVRFDAGYYSAFKCNLKALRDYPHLSRYAQALYEAPGVAETVDVDLYRRGYHSASPLRNPLGIIPIGPQPTFT